MTRARGFADLIMLAVMGGAAAIFLAGAALWLHRDRAEQFKAGQAETQQRWDRQTTERLATAIEDSRLAAAETFRRLNKQQENQVAQDRILAQSRRDAAAATAAVDGLLLRAARYLSAAGCSLATGDTAGRVQQHGMTNRIPLRIQRLLHRKRADLFASREHAAAVVRRVTQR